MRNRSCHDLYHSRWQPVAQLALLGQRPAVAPAAIVQRLAEVAVVLVWIVRWLVVDLGGFELVVRAARPLDGLQALKDHHLAHLDVTACLSLWAFPYLAFLLELVVIWSLVAPLDRYV